MNKSVFVTPPPLHDEGPAPYVKRPENRPGGLYRQLFFSPHFKWQAIRFILITFVLSCAAVIAVLMLDAGWLDPFLGKG